MLAFFVYMFSFHQSNRQNLMFVLSSWHYFELQFFYNYNLFRRVPPFLTQRVGAIECQIMIFRSSYSYWTLGISSKFNNVESNSYNFFLSSSSKCCPCVALVHMILFFSLLSRGLRINIIQFRKKSAKNIIEVWENMVLVPFLCIRSGFFSV